MFKKILRITAITLLVLVALAFILPVVFRGRIIRLVKTEINKKVNARVDFRDVSISLFRHFPRLTVGLQDLYVANAAPFAGDTLLSVPQLEVALNLVSAIRGKNMEVYAVLLEAPRIHAIVNPAGQANWDILKPDTTTATADSSKSVQLQLQQYAIRHALIRYNDAPGHLQATISDLNHEGKGDFTADLFTLATHTTAGTADVSYGGIPYLSKAQTAIDLDLEVNNRNRTYRFNSRSIQVNELQLSTQGSVQQLPDSTYQVDVQFKAPSTDFRHILSLIPAVYRNNFAAVKTSGTAVFGGFIKGIAGKDRLPAYQAQLAIRNGFFQYPDLPEAVRNIRLEAQVSNPDGVPDHTVLRVSDAHIELGDAPFDFRLLVQNPVSDLLVEAAAKGNLDLSRLSRLVKLEKGTRLGGLLTADVELGGRQSALTSKQYDRFKAAGSLALHNFLYGSAALPDNVRISNLLLDFTPQRVNLHNLEGRFAGTAFTADGSISNLLAYLFGNQPLNAVLNAQADQVNVNTWMGLSADTSRRKEPFLVPANLDVTVNAAAGRVLYNNLGIENLSGSLAVANETIRLSNVKGKALGGTILLSGYYSTLKDKHKPEISFNYDIAQADVQQTFNTFNTAQLLMPVGKFLSGKLSTQLNVAGRLGSNLLPEPASLSGAGNLLLAEGVLSGFAPLEKLSQALHLQTLQRLATKEVKAAFAFANGQVVVKPFHLKVKDIEMDISGTHSLDQHLDYTIHLQVARALLGSQANSLIQGWTAQAAAHGLAINPGEVIPLQVKMGGTITNPTIQTDIRSGTTALVTNI
jgi:hypothetical protein